MNARLQLPCLTNQFNPVTSRHPDIRDQKLRLFIPHQLERMNSIIRNADNLKPLLLPINQLLQEQHHLFFVIGKYYLNH